MNQFNPHRPNLNDEASRLAAAAAEAARLADRRRSREDAAAKAAADALLVKDAAARDEASRALNKAQTVGPLSPLKSPKLTDSSSRLRSETPEDGDRAAHQGTNSNIPKLLLLAQQLTGDKTEKDEAERVARRLRLLEALQMRAFESGVAYETPAHTSKLSTAMGADRADRSIPTINLDRGLSALTTKSDAIQRERNLLQLELLLEDPTVRRSAELTDTIARAVDKLRGVVEDERRGLVEANAKRGAELAESGGAFYSGISPAEAFFGPYPQIIRNLERVELARAG